LSGGSPRTGADSRCAGQTTSWTAGGRPSYCDSRQRARIARCGRR
jgi:hypothetical protein